MEIMDFFSGLILIDQESSNKRFLYFIVVSILHIIFIV